ncbi:MAG: mannose-1-phosphate guanylyltransferase/mannose-6-phosphate isomerase [Alphaproteobacteria bacterium]
MADQRKSGPQVWPVLMAGGTGTRLWPMSRGLFPKQFMALVTSDTMLTETARRFSGKQIGGQPVAAPIAIVNDAHRFIAGEQLRDAGVTPEAIVLEPIGRNTAPAAAIAALMIIERDPEGIMLLAPADHVINNTSAFARVIETALPAVRMGHLVTFGVTPARPETGYGYIERGEAIAGQKGCFVLDRFIEKPDLGTAETYVNSGRHFWNSGIFLMGAQVYLDELERHAPAVLKSARAALEKAERDLDFIRLDSKALAASPNISIDYAVMEKTSKGVIVPSDMGWSDVGSWTALWNISKKDARGNVLRGDVIAHDVTGSYVRSEKPLVAVLGLENVIVVATDDVVLVSAKHAAQDVKAVVEKLANDGRPEPLSHTTVFRPWGAYRSMDQGKGFQVKHITVNPGGRLSLQKHAKRAEHWVVVGGTATVTRNEEEREVHVNESVYIPIGTAHRLENRTSTPLHLIEVQSGSYLGEDDIVRLEDAYGRD